MTEVGIFDGDILVVDRAIKPRNTHIVVAIVDGEFTVKLLSQRVGRIKLKSANPTYPDITPKDGQTIEIWGVVVIPPCSTGPKSRPVMQPWPNAALG